MITKAVKILSAICIVGVGGYFAGPKVTFEPFDNEPSAMRYEISQLDKIISDRESSFQNLKEDNEARIVWADSIPKKTKYSVVYLHGFTATHGEGYPMHLNLADSLHANLYLPRLPEHGIQDKEAMKHLTPKMLVDGAKDAIAVGKSIGEKVILLSCSTGGTLSIFLGAADPSLEALILLSPNIALNSSAAGLMTGPWGKELTYQLIGEHRDMTNFQNSKEYWTYLHHSNGLIALQSLMDQTMNKEIFSKLKMPIYCGYYYKNEEVQDPTVSVDAMLEFQKSISTPEEYVEFEAFPEGNHVLSSVYKNKNWEVVQNEVWDFVKRQIVN